MKTFSSGMKTSFRRRTKRRRWIVVVAAVAALFVALTFLRGPLGYVASYGMTPLRASALSADGFLGKVAGYFKGVNALVAERNALRDSTIAQDAETQTFAARAADATMLAEVDVPGRIPAGVLFAPPHTPYDTLVIDQGSADGVRRGRIVYAPGSIAIGTVLEARANSSVVGLFSSPGVRSRVYVHGPNVAAEAEGRGGGVIQISVPQGIMVSEGDQVVLPTLSPSVFGEVSSVEANPANPATYAYVTLPIALSSLRFVSVSGTEYASPSLQDLEAVVERSRALFDEYFTAPDAPTTTSSTTLTLPEDPS